jgi:hypothetical protein
MTLIEVLLQAGTTAIGWVLSALHGRAGRHVRAILIVALVAMNGAMLVTDPVGTVLNLATTSVIYLLHQTRGGST